MRASGSKPRNEGFSLLEILLAVTLTAVVVAVVAGAFQAGMNGYRSGTTRAALQQEGRGGLLLLGDDVSRALPVVNEAVSFEPARLRFEAVSPNGAGIRQVAYELTDGALTRRWGDSDRNDGEAFDVLREVSSIRFEYLSGGAWRERVPAGTFPGAVRVSVELGGERGGAFRSVFRFPAPANFGSR